MKSTPFFLSSIISFVTSLIEALLGVRFILKLFGASAKAPFVKWIYVNTETLLTPFANIFPSPNISGLVIEFSTIFALIVYTLIGYLITQLLDNFPNNNSKRKEKE